MSETSGKPPGLTDLKCTDCGYPVYAYEEPSGQVTYGHDQMDVNAKRACPSPALADQRGKPFYPSAPSHLLPCGCLPNDAGAHRVGCPDHPEGVRGR